MLKQTIKRTLITGTVVIMLVSTAAPAMAAPARYDASDPCIYITQWWRCK